MGKDLVSEGVVTFHEKIGLPGGLFKVVEVAHGEFYMVTNGGLLKISKKSAEEFVIPFAKECVWTPVGIDHCAVFFGAFNTPRVEVVNDFRKFFGTSV